MTEPVLPAFAQATRNDSSFDMMRTAGEPRSAYMVFQTICTQWVDNEAYENVSDVVYCRWFDTAVFSSAHPLPNRLA